MGKVRVKTLGVEEAEQEQKEQNKKRKQTKETKKLVKGAHGGERVVAVGPSEEELAKIEVPQGETSRDTRGTRKPRDTRPRQRGRRHKQALATVDKTKLYSLPEALELLRKVGYTKFDGTVELHINTVEKGISGQVSLPHGTGKQTRVAIADDKLVEQVEKGKIDFDVLLATPDMMAKLAKVAKFLGPRGLMPNPKNGTIADDPQKLAQSMSQGNRLRFKTETSPIIHLSVGRLSMKDSELVDNIQAILSAIGSGKIKNITLKSTMSPGIKLDTVAI